MSCTTFGAIFVFISLFATSSFEPLQTPKLHLCQEVDKLECQTNTDTVTIQLKLILVSTAESHLIQKNVRLNGCESRTTIIPETGIESAFFKLQSTNLTLSQLNLQPQETSVSTVDSTSSLTLSDCELRMNFETTHAVVNSGGDVLFNRIVLTPISSRVIVSLVKGVCESGHITLSHSSFADLIVRSAFLVTDHYAQTVTINHCTFQNISEDLSQTVNAITSGQQSCMIADCVFNHVVNGLYGTIVMGAYGSHLHVETSIFEQCLTTVSAEEQTKMHRTSVVYKSNSFTDLTSVTSGGAINVPSGGEHEIHSCSFKSCKAEQSGGAVYFGSTGSLATIFIKSSTFENSHANLNGGTICVFGDLSMKSCHVKEGSTNRSGAAVWIGDKTSLLNIDSCTFEKCSAELNGGSVYVGEMTHDAYIGFHSSTVEESTTGEHGGAIYLTSLAEGSQLVIKKSTLRNNAASANGGHLYVHSLANRSSIAFILSSFKNGFSQNGKAGGFFFSKAQTAFMPNPQSGLGEQPAVTQTISFDTSRFYESKSQGDGKDIYAEEGWSRIFNADSFVKSYSDSSHPRIFIDGLGDKSEWLPDPPFPWATLFGFLGGSLLIIAIVLVIICFCPCCSCLACFPFCRQYPVRMAKSRRAKALKEGAESVSPSSKQQELHTAIGTKL